MKCLHCGKPSTSVIDSRLTRANHTRRRRECDACKTRFSTVEFPMEQLPMKEILRAIMDFQARINSVFVQVSSMEERAQSSAQVRSIYGRQHT